MSGIASSIEYCRSPTAVAAAVYFLPCFPMGHSPFFDWRFATRDFKATNRPSRTQSQITNRKSHMSSASADDIDSHRPRRATNRLDGRFERITVQVRKLRLGDVLDLLGRHG